MTKPTWRYISPGALVTSEIHANLDELKDYIMFSAERLAVLNTVARRVMGQSILLHGGSISNLLDEASIEKIAISVWQKFWSKFLIFGNISVGYTIRDILMYKSCQTNIGHTCTWIRPAYSVQVVGILNRSHIGFINSAFITPGAKEA